MLSSRVASHHRDQNQISCVAGGFLSTRPCGNPLIRGLLGANGKETQASMFEEEVREYYLEEEMCRLRPEEPGVRQNEW